MIQEVYKGIYRITIPLEGNPLKSLNAYFIKSEGKQLLIDTGFRTESCKSALQYALKELQADPKRIEIALTHFHADHSGNVNEVSKYDNIVYMGEPDVLCSFMRGEGEFLINRDARLLSEGFQPEWLEHQYAHNPAYNAWMEDPFAINFFNMKTDDVIRIGEFELTWVLVPGHTPGNSMLYEKKHKLMFTGDHILFDITPNITSWPTMTDALGSYLESLKNSMKYDVQIALPGHREYSGADYYKRIQSLLQHHKNRLDQVISIIQDHPGLNAVEICSRMTWKIRCKDWDTFPTTQKLFAVGETFSHLDYLLCRNMIVKEKGVDGCYRYMMAFG